MDATIEEILHSFLALPESQKHEIAAEVLRWSRAADHPALQDEEFSLTADELFLAYEDEEER
jgi:hypothetical protein